MHSTRMGMYMYIVAAIVVLALSFQQAGSVSLDEGPQRQMVANVGGTVQLTCDLRELGARRVHWYHKETRRYLSVNRAIFRRLPNELKTRLAILGDPRLQQFNLRIQDLKQSDSGTYSCQYAFPEEPTRSVGSSTITVYIPPDPGSPECHVESTRTTGAPQVGDWVTLRCLSTGSPPPVVTYRRGDSQEGLPSSTSPVSLQWQLVPQDNGVDFTCTMTSPVLDGPRTCSVRPLEIFPRAEVAPAQVTTKEGYHVSLVCRGLGEPSIASYRWVIKDAVTERELPAYRYKLNHTHHLVEILSVRENITVTCFVTTPLGLSGNASAMIKVIPHDVRGITTITTTTTSLPHSEQTTTVLSTNTHLNTTESPGNSSVGNSRRPITAKPTGTSLPITPIIAASLAALATLAVILCICCVRRRRRRNRKPLVSSLRYDKVRRSSSGADYFATTSQANTTSTTVQIQPVNNAVSCPLYAAPDKPRRGQPRDLEEDQFLSSSGIPLKAVSKKRRRNGVKKRPALKPPLENHTAKESSVKPKKPSKRVKWNLDKNGYCVAKIENFGAAEEASLVYAELELHSSPGCSRTAPDSFRSLSTVSDGDETIYAQITNQRRVTLDFGNVL